MIRIIINTSSIYYDTYHKLFVLRVKTSEDGVGFYNYYTRWTVVEGACFPKSRVSMYNVHLTHSLLCFEFVELTLIIKPKSVIKKLAFFFV